MLRAAGILFTHGGRVLLLKRAESAQDAPGTWGLPGGHIEHGETPEATARRETFEETGHHYDGPLHYLGDATNGFRYFGAALDKPFEPVINHEHTAVQWAPLDKLPSPMHPSFAELGAMTKHANDHLVKGRSDAIKRENIAAEIRAGKSPAQAVAIGYAVQREARASDGDTLATRPMALDAGQRKGALDAIRGAADRCLAPVVKKG